MVALADNTTWLNSQLRTVDRVFADTFRPRPRPVRSRWCADNIRLPSDLSATPGAYSFTDREYIREPMDAVDDPAVKEVVLVWATQSGKTTFVEAISASQGAIDAAPMMLAGPDQLYSRDRREMIYKICDVSPVLMNKVPPLRFRNDRWIDLGGCRIYLAWSGSTQRLSGRACKVVLCSEVDRWASSVTLAQERVKAFWSHTVIFEGAPIGISDRLWPLYQQSDRRTFHVPCPRCGHYQELRFFPHGRGHQYAYCGGVGGLVDDEGNSVTPEHGRLNAYYICEKGCRIEAHEKDAMVARGVWCPVGCHVVDGVVTGTPTYSGNRRGYQLNSLYSSQTTIGAMAEKWLLSRDSEDERKRFFNDWLALPFEPRGKVPRWNMLAVQLRGAHDRGVVPAQALFLTCGCDFQEDSTYWIVRAWGEHKTSWLIDFGILKRSASGDPLLKDTAFIRLRDDVLDRDWQLAGLNPLDQKSLRVCRAGHDSGGHETQLVYEFIQNLGYQHVFAVKGDSAIASSEPYRFSLIEADEQSGKRRKYGARLWLINSSYYKAAIQDRWNMRYGMPGFWYATNQASGGDSETYFRQLTNEVRVRETNKRTGHTKEIWKLVNKDVRSDFLDCEVYSEAMADMVVERQWENLTERFRSAMGLEEQQRRQKAEWEADDNGGRGGGFVIRSPGTGFLRGRR